MILEYPAVRGALFAWLRDTRNPGMFLDLDEVHELTHFLFDDHCFDPSAEYLLGGVFYEPEELAATSKFVRAFDAALGPGRHYPDLTKVDWAPVIEAAAQALEILERKGY